MRGTITSIAPSGEPPKVERNRRARPGWRVDTTAAALPSPQSTQLDRSVVDDARVVLDAHAQHVVRQRRPHLRQKVQVRAEGGARRLQVERRHLEAQLAGHGAGLGRDAHLRRAAPRHHHAHVFRRDARALERHARRGGARLRVGVARRAVRLAWIDVLRGPDVVERQHRAPRVDAHALQDPRIGRADVEPLEERIVEHVLRVEVAEGVEVQHRGRET
jgi:hypothetical protein